MFVWDWHFTNSYVMEWHGRLEQTHLIQKCTITCQQCRMKVRIITCAQIDLFLSTKYTHSYYSETYSAMRKMKHFKVLYVLPQIYGS